jgi:nicotinamide-nucleotide amidase
MSRGALAHAPADIAVSITGVAGPQPDEDGNPVGRVCIGLARNEEAKEREFHYGKLGRNGVQNRAMRDALELLSARSRKANEPRRLSFRAMVRSPTRHPFQSLERLLATHPPSKRLGVCRGTNGRG